MFVSFFHVGPSIEDPRIINVYDGEYLPLYTVKKVVGDIINKLADLAEHQIVHGDGRTTTNLMFTLIYFVVSQLLPSTISSSCAPKVVMTFSLKQFKNRKAESIQVVGADGVTYPSVISQPIHREGFTWDTRRCGV
jgi:hypothetical protein